MPFYYFFLLVFCLPLSFLLQYSNFISNKGEITIPYNRFSFPHNFSFGSGIAAYQNEGSPLKNGRGASIWDEYLAKYPERIDDRSTAELASDFYTKYEEDIKLAKEIGMDSLRMSISWSRIFPSGTIKGGVNEIGVQYYNKVFDDLISNGIKPFVTLYLFDTPLALENAYGGPLSPSFINDFTDYAEFCFKTYGDRVKLWTTINEPNIFSQIGYSSPMFPPARCSRVDGDCSSGDSATEPYLVSHHMLLAHATAAKLYKTKYQAKQKGSIGMNIAADWYYPLNDTLADRQAVARGRDFTFARILHPLTFGDYPETLKKLVGNRLPTLTEQQSKMLIHSQDFLTLNYYSSFYAYDAPSLVNKTSLSILTDGGYGRTGYRNGVAIGEQSASPIFFTYPKGLYDLLMYIKENYKNPIIYITENGYATNGTLTFKEAINDQRRISYIKGHLSYLLKAIQGGCNVKGYMVWALTDNWVWTHGFTLKYGLIHVDFKTLTRYFRASALWYQNFLSK